jgi:hypothetical protein
MEKRSTTFTHLTPYPEKLQGKPWVNVSSSLSIIDSCDKVVLAGGGFTAWCEAVLRYAHSKNIPIYLSELAYGSFLNLPKNLPINKFSVLTPTNKDFLSKNLAIDSSSVVVTGSPQMIDKATTCNDLVLLLSTSDANIRDPQFNLKSIATYFKENNQPYLVRTHPREDRSLWEGFNLSTNQELKSDLEKAKIVIGYPGTPSLIVIANGIPLINLSPNDSFQGIIPKEYNSLVVNTASDANSVNSFLDKTLLPSSKVVNELLGFYPNAARNIVDFWES